MRVSMASEGACVCVAVGIRQEDNGGVPTLSRGQEYFIGDVLDRIVADVQ
jgi:hypothetical protein